MPYRRGIIKLSLVAYVDVSNRGDLERMTSQGCKRVSAYGRINNVRIDNRFANEMNF